MKCEMRVSAAPPPHEIAYLRLLRGGQAHNNGQSEMETVDLAGLS